MLTEAQINMTFPTVLHVVGFPFPNPKIYKSQTTVLFLNHEPVLQPTHIFYSILSLASHNPKVTH